MSSKNFDEWNIQKKELNEGKGKLYKAREIWWCALGVNVGYEQDGSEKSFHRPVLIVRGFSRQVCLAVPLTTSIKQNPYHVSLGKIEGRDSFAIISQIKLIDTRRLVDKIGMLDKQTFEEVKNTLRTMF